MRRRKRNFGLLGVSLLSFLALVYIILNFSPSLKISLYSLNFPVVFLFFILFFIFLYSLFSFLLVNKRRGILIALFTVSYLTLRLNGLTNLFFVILLIILFGSLELLFVRRK